MRGIGFSRCNPKRRRGHLDSVGNQANLAIAHHIGFGWEESVTLFMEHFKSLFRTFKASK